MGFLQAFSGAKVVILRAWEPHIQTFTNEHANINILIHGNPGIKRSQVPKLKLEKSTVEVVPALLLVSQSTLGVCRGGKLLQRL